METAKKRVLILGATGHSGQYAIERFAERCTDASGYTFRVLVRPTSDLTPITSYGLPLEIVRGDISDDADLRRAMEGVSVVLNVFGIIDRPQRVARFAADAGVKRLISVHTTGIYSRYKNARKNYIESDEQTREVCRGAGIPLSILRPTMIYGAPDDQNMIRFIKMVDRLPVMPVVEGARFVMQPVHRRDLGHAYADIVLSPATVGRDYVLSGDRPIELREILIDIGTCLGKRVRFISFPFRFAYGLAWILYGISFKRVDYRERVQRLVEPRAYPHDEAARDFGYAPMPFHQGILQEVTEYRKLKR